MQGHIIILSSHDTESNVRQISQTQKQAKGQKTAKNQAQCTAIWLNLPGKYAILALNHFSPGGCL